MCARCLSLPPPLPRPQRPLPVARLRACVFFAPLRLPLFLQDVDPDLVEMRDMDVNVTAVLDLTSRPVKMFDFTLAHGPVSSDPGMDPLRGGGGGGGGDPRPMKTLDGLPGGTGAGGEDGGPAPEEGEGGAGGALHEARVGAPPPG